MEHKKKRLISASWVLPISQRPIRNGAILLKGDSILEIGPKKELLKKNSSSYKVNLGNVVLLPGFVNTHCHLVHEGRPDSPRDFSSWFEEMVRSVRKQQKTKKGFKLVVKRGVQELIHSGVTTVADSGPSVVPLKILKKSGLRSIFYHEIFGFIEKDPKTLMARLNQQIKKIQEKLPSRVQYGLAPHSPYTMPTQMFRELSRFCEREQIPFTTHVAESPEETLFFQKGNGAISKIFPGRNKLLPRSRSSIQYLSSNRIFGNHLLLVHCVQVDKRDISLMAKKGSNVSYCPTSNHFLNVGKAPIHEFLEKKISVGLGTDSVATSGSLNFFQTLRDAALLGNLSSEQVVQMATLGGAKAMGLEKQIGSLQKGKKADLIAIDLKDHDFKKPVEIFQHLVWKSQPRDLILSMVDGKKIN